MIGCAMHVDCDALATIRVPPPGLGAATAGAEGRLGGDQRDKRHAAQAALWPAMVCARRKANNR
jgi:hypothetical protein